MKAITLLATLKTERESNTLSLCEFFKKHLAAHNVENEIIRLVDYNITPGTYSDMGNGDEWPVILEKILKADIIIFATPVWWGGHSSQMQMVIERLDEIHDEILQGKKSKLEGRAGGIIVSGDSDGAQHIIANIANFYNAMGIALPPFASFTVLWEKFKKSESPTEKEIKEKLEKEYAKTAETMARQLTKYAGQQ
jgi:multimeric flavodoxin WrbA